MKNKYIRYALTILCCIFAFYLFSTTPAFYYIFGLGPSDTCEEFRKAPTKAHVDFLIGCECLTIELSDKLIEFDLQEKVEDCFYNKVRTCLGGERIGDMYKSCAESVVP